MILVRDVLQIDPMQMKAAREVVQQSETMLATTGYPRPKMMTDLTGDFYRLVLEGEFADLASYEREMTKTMAHPDWQAFYGKLRPMVKGGSREVFTILA